MFESAGEWLGDLRASATRSRELVYEATWTGFWESPLLGHGWPGEAVYPEDWPQVMEGGGTMVPGSHSTFLGLLYLGGVATFAAFLFALTWTVGLVASAPNWRRPITRNTLVLLFGMTLAGIGESLFSIVVPTLFVFIWLGIALRGCRWRPVRSAARSSIVAPSIVQPAGASG
jgi:O-antigen ligase